MKNFDCPTIVGRCSFFIQNNFVSLPLSNCRLCLQFDTALEAVLLCRGSVMGMNLGEEKSGYTVIEAEVPKAEMVDYSIALRAMTQGRGTYTFYFERYAEVPGNIAQKIIAEAKNDND